MLWSQHSGRVVVFCRAINETFPEKAIAAQRIDSLWYIYIKDDETKNKLIIDGFKLDSVTIPVYSVNPYGSNQRNNDTQKNSYSKACSPRKQQLHFGLSKKILTS